MASLANDYAQQKQREEQMIQQINLLVDQEIAKLQLIADTSSTYISFSQQLMSFWESQSYIRDSLVNSYADDNHLKHQCVEIWAQVFGLRMMQIDTQVKQSKPLQ